MFTEQRPLACLGDDAPAPPEVHPTPSLIAGDYGWLSWLKHHSSIVGSVRTSKPPLAPSERFTISLHPNGPIGIAIDEIAPALPKASKAASGMCAHPSSFRLSSLLLLV